MQGVKGFTITELLVASSIAVLVVGGAFALWFMTQDTWINERIKSELLQELQTSMERIKREMKISDSGKMFFHVAGSVYDAISFPIALDDGRSDTGYNGLESADGFIEPDSSTLDPITGVAKVWWDQTVIYHSYNNGNEYELKRTVFYPRDNSLDATQSQQQIDNVVSLGTGNDPTVPNFSNWQSTRTIFKADLVSLKVKPKLLEFDGYSITTERTENLIDFGSAVLDGGYHTIKFTVTGKNSDSAGYAFGMDSLCFTPPGSLREAENFKNLIHPDNSSGVDSSSGDVITTVNMHESPFGLWSADYYLDYAANSVDDYLTLRFYYDRWYETTFLEGVSDNVIVEFSNIDGKGGALGAEEWLVRLEGNEKTWDAPTQTQELIPGSLQILAPPGGGDIEVTYRNLLLSNYTISNGMKVSIKFHAGISDPLVIQSAYIIQRDHNVGASPDDGSSDMPSIPITFSSCNLDPRNLGQSGLPTPTGNGVTIPTGCYAWSNWIQLYDNSNVNFNFDETKDYFISIYIIVPEGTTESILYWQDTTSTPEIHSYVRNGGKFDNVAVWGGAGTADVSIYSIEEVDVTYVDTGSFNSQVFDTGVEDPNYSTMKWKSIVNSPDATLQMRIRTSDSKAALEADGDWTSIPGLVLASSPASLVGLAQGRYVQFRTDLAATVSGGDSSHITNDTDDTYPGDEDYDLSCVLKDISIYWPGNTTMVDVSGYFTKEPNYGLFAVEIDGQQLIKGFEIKMTITEDLTTGSTVTRSINTEVEPRNTNK